MRVSREEKERSRARIIESAARRLRERGIEGTGVADVMADAGLSHGGFYRHFESKDALLAAAFEAAISEMLARVTDERHRDAPERAVADFIALYLSDRHVQHPARGCPIPAVASDAARGEPSVQGAFGDGVQRTLEALARGLPGDDRERRAAAARALAAMAGAVMIARATDKVTAHEVLAAVREDLLGTTRRRQPLR